MPTIDMAAETIWDYMRLHQELKKADALFVLCSLDKRVAGTAAKLFINGYADWIIFSGGYGELTKHRFIKTEAEAFADVALSVGVPSERIIIENKSSNTGENIQFTYNLLKDKNRNFKSFILVQKPYMERRTYATFKKQWPDDSTRFSVRSTDLSFNQYCNEEMTKDLVINIMVGDLQRIREYPKLGFQIEQEIPENVWQAYEFLIDNGFTDHLIK